MVLTHVALHSEVTASYFSSKMIQLQSLVVDSPNRSIDFINHIRINEMNLFSFFLNLVMSEGIERATWYFSSLRRLRGDWNSGTVSSSSSSSSSSSWSSSSSSSSKMSLLTLECYTDTLKLTQPPLFQLSFTSST